MADTKTIKDKTKSGFKFEVSEKTLDNMELVDAIAEAEEDGAKISKVVTILLGKSQKSKLYDHLRDDDGIVSVESVGDEILEIFEILGEQGKN